MGALEADRCSRRQAVDVSCGGGLRHYLHSRGRRSARRRRRNTNCSDLPCFPLAGSGISGSVRMFSGSAHAVGSFSPPAPNNQEFQTSELISCDETGAGGAGMLVQIGSGQLIINLQEAGRSPCLPSGGWQEHNP